MCRLILCFFLSLAIAHSAKRAFTIEDLYRVKSLKDLAVSPNGKSVAFAVTTSDLPKAKQTTHLWMMDADGGSLRQLTYGDKSESTPAFSPDGKSIAFVSTRDGSANLYLLPMNGGESRRLTTLSTSVSDPLWSPDGKLIAFTSDVYPECGASDECNKKIAERWSKGKLQAHMADSLLYRHWTDWKDGKRTHILLVDVTSGDVRDATPGDFDSPPFGLGGQLQYDFSPDSKELTFTSNRGRNQASSTNSDLWVLPLAGQAQPRNITDANPAYDGNPKYSPDGRYIGYRMQKQPGYESDLFRLTIYDRAARTSRVLTDSFLNWVEDFQWSDDSKSIYFSAPVEGNIPLHQLDLQTGKISVILRDRAISSYVIAKGGRMNYIRSSVGEPPEIYADGKKLTSFNASLAAEVDIRSAERMSISNIDTFIVKPHDFDPAKKYPLILNVHGGPQYQWADSFRGDWQVYPGAGYVVAFANPHGSTGYGQDFTAQISGDYGGRVFDDLMKVTGELAKLPYVDRDRMGAMGWSFGGYMMNWFEGHTDRFKAIVSMMGLYNLTSFYGATEELWFPEWDLKGQPWNSKDYEKYSPSSYVKQFKTPCLIISGERDYRVPYTQSLEFFTALQKMKVPSRLIVYSNAGHWPDWYEMALYYTAHLEWFQKYLGGGPPPWTSEKFLRNAVFDTSAGKRIE